MKNITKFTEQSFHKFSTPEYVTLMDRFISQTAAMGAEKLHYEEADMARLRELQGQLQNNCAHTTATENTAKITILDGQRTALGQYIINTVKNCITLPMAGKSEAATAMYVVLKPYYGFYNKTTTQKTAILDGMLADLSNEEIAAHITTLGLEDAIENLTLKNAQLKVQVDMRTQTRKTKQNSGQRHSPPGNGCPVQIYHHSSLCTQRGYSKPGGRCIHCYHQRYHRRNQHQLQPAHG